MADSLVSQVRAWLSRPPRGDGRDETEQALRASKERLAWVLDQTGVGTWLNTLPLGKLSWDLQTRRLFFVRPEAEPTIELFWSRLHPDDREPTRQAIEEAIRDRTLYSVDHRAVDPETGQVRWIRSIGQATYGPDGSPMRFDGINFDITERKQVEEALNVHRQLLETVVNQMPAAVCLIRGSDLRLQLVNPAYQAIAPGKEMVGKTLDELWPETGQDFAAICHRVLETGEPHQVVDELNMICRRPDGPLEAAYFSWSMQRVHLPADEGWGLIIGAWETTVQRRTQDALRASEARLRQALEAGEVFTFEWDPASDAVLRSPNCRSILGWDSDATRDTGQSFFAAIHAEDREAFLRTVTRLTPEHPAYVATYRYLRRGDGREVVLEETGRAAFSDTGAMVGLHGLTRDVTERKRAEEALRESAARLRLAQASAGAGIWDWDIGTGTLEWSEELSRLFGLDPATHQASFESWRAVIHPDDRRLAEHRIEAAVANHASLASEYRIVLPSGEVRWISALGLATYDPDGAPRRMSGICIDITARKGAEAALRHSREDLDRAQEVGQVGSWRLDVRRNVLTWSDENYRIFGASAGTPQTYDSFLETVHPDDREYVDAMWSAALRGEPYDIEHRIVVHGQVKWVREKAYLEFDEAGGLRGGFGITQDITDRKLAEQKLRESLAEKELLLREIHHRVKNNLQVVSSLVSLQADALTDPRFREVFNDVRNRVRSMGLVHEKLYQSGGLSRLDFADYAAGLTRSLWNVHGAVGARVKLQLEVEPVALPVATAVPCGLILNELVSNALKHAFPSGGGTITVGLAREPASGRLCLRVRDDGVGLAAGFDWRHARSLGLRLVQMLAAQLDGSVEAGPGPGTEFCVSFVAKETEGGEAVAAGESSPRNDRRA